MPNWIPVQAWYDTESGRYYMGAQPPMNPQSQQQYYSPPQPQQPQQQYYSSPQPQQQYYSPPQPQQQYYRNVPSNHVMLGGQGGLVRYYQPMYQQPVTYEYYHNSYGQPVPMRVYPNNYGYPAQIGAYTGETNWQAAFPQQQQQEVQQTQQQAAQYVPPQIVEEEVPSGAVLGEQIVQDAIDSQTSYTPLPSVSDDSLDNLISSANTAINSADTTLTSGISVDENGDVNIEPSTNEQALKNVKQTRKQRKKELEEKEYNRIYSSPIGL